MKMKLIAAAVSMIAAAPAFALNVADTAAAITAGNVVRASGASAPTNIVFRGFEGLCKAGTLDTYSSKTVAANIKPGSSEWGNFLAYSCTLPAGTAGFAADTNVAFLHTVDGGSIKSLYGMSTDAGQQVAFITDALTSCVDSNKIETDTSAKIYHKCATAKKQSHGGFSDVEKQMWASLFDSVPPIGVDVADVAVTAVPAGQAFGVAVSKALYEALQVAQGLTGCDGDNVTVACQPSITKRDYASIVNSNPDSVTKLNWDFLVPGSTKKVHLCRRADTSGTQASSNVYFLNNPCGNFADQPGARTVANVTDSDTGFQVYDLSGTGDAKKCLTGGYAGYTTTASDFSIGVVSAENKATVPATTGATADSWRFVKLDGVAIYDIADGGNNRANVLNGKYDFAFELVLHTHPTITSTVANNVMTEVAAYLGNSAAPAIDGLYRIADAKGTRGGNSCKPFAY